MSNFTKEIDTIVKALQNKHNKYSLYYTFEPEEFRFKKGDVIGYSGDTGTISGPHIHYELRDSLGRPYNPLYEYNIIDSKSPVVNQIAFIPLDFKTTINELSRTQTFNFNRSTSNIYELKDTIAVNGKFGLGINVIDKVNQQPFSYGIHKIELYIDDKKTYEVSYDIYNYSDKRYIYNERDYQLKIDTGKTFYRLFSDVNKNMLFINPKYASEYVFFQDNDYHEFKIVISDFNNNKVFASGTILNKKLPIINTIHDNQNIMFDNILNDEYEYKFYNTGKNDLDQIFLNNNAFINDQKISWPLSEKPFSVLKIDIKSKDGTKYLPQYIQIIQDEISEIKGNFNLKHYKHGLILEFQTDNFSKEIPRFTYEDDGYRKELNMHRTSKNLFESKLITPLDFSNYKNIEIHFETIPEYVFNYKTNQILTKPKQEFKLLHNGGQTILRGKKYTFDDTTIVWIEENIELIKNETTTITNPIFIGPIRLNFKKSMELIIRVPNRNDLDYSSIYKYDEYNNEWKYIPSVVNKKELSLVSDINSGGIYAVIKEKKPPVIDNIYPGNNASYYQNDFREIIFNIYDNQSGIKDESNIKVQIDEEKPLIFEYNSYRKQVTYKLHKKMLKGKHQLTIEAYDNAGNKKNIINKFYIKENKE